MSKAPDQHVISIDWAHHKKNIAVFDGKKFLGSLPDAKKAAENGIVIATENMPLMKARSYLDAGVPIMCLNTWDVKKERERQGIPKSHQADARVIHELYAADPERFRPFKIDPNIMRVRALHATFKDVQEERKRAGNRHFAYRDKVSLQKFEQMKAEEARYKRMMVAEAERWPIYTQFAREMPGLAPPSVIGLIAILGDIDRFKTVSSMWAYFGLHTVNGVAPRRKEGEVANWHQRGRAHVLGAMAAAFFAHDAKWFAKPENIANPYVALFLSEKARQIPIVAGQFPDLDEDKVAGRAYLRAKRRAMKEFLKHFFLEYKRLGGCLYEGDTMNSFVSAQPSIQGQGDGVLVPTDTHSPNGVSPAPSIATSVWNTLIPRPAKKRPRVATAKQKPALKKRATKGKLMPV
jgi:hypothetical protein